MAEKKYVIENADLMAEWNWEKNNELGFNPNTLTNHSGKKVWWICANGHSFDATIANRSNGRGCPYCSGHKVISKVNDVATLYPNIAEEWNTSKNGDLLPSMFSPGSRKKYGGFAAKVMNGRRLSIVGHSSAQAVPFADWSNKLHSRNKLFYSIVCK